MPLCGRPCTAPAPACHPAPLPLPQQPTLLTPHISLPSRHQPPTHSLVQCSLRLGGEGAVGGGGLAGHGTPGQTDDALALPVAVGAGVARAWRSEGYDAGK